MDLERPFPLWQPDEAEYRAACAYLGLTPRTDLYARLLAHLAEAPFRAPPPRGFARHLAGLRWTRFRLGRLDLASKLLFPTHPVRHLLNGVIALHECDPRGYAELSRAPSGAALWPALAAWALGFGGNLVLTMAWLAWHFAWHVLSLPFRNDRDLSGLRVLVTGAQRGLGLDLALEALERGARVVATVRREGLPEGPLGRLPRQAPLRLVVADLGRAGALSAALERAGLTPGDIDLAILCAGVKHADSVLAEEPLANTFQVNLFAPVEFARWYYLDGAGKTLTLVSSMGRWHGMHGSAGYNASKAALSIWGESLELELRRLGQRQARVVIVEPGLFTSGMLGGGGLKGLLATPRRALAGNILSAAIAGRRTLRSPYWFAVLTWAVCLGGRGLRQRVFARANPGQDGR